MRCIACCVYHVEQNLVGAMPLFALQVWHWVLVALWHTEQWTLCLAAETQTQPRPSRQQNRLQESLKLLATAKPRHLQTACQTTMGTLKPADITSTTCKAAAHSCSSSLFSDVGPAIMLALAIDSSAAADTLLSQCLPLLLQCIDALAFFVCNSVILQIITYNAGPALCCCSDNPNAQLKHLQHH